uniref:Uncharacterized protein n=1 Tax=Candidatus Kentrum sp. SD TaxID=2126332 RepID=A0A451BJQ8_9GAMM|nr:MAG: hypothetical protein BECKSD772D_GA0070982_101540 [Candidatus Kentron sp. SD]
MSAKAARDSRRSKVTRDRGIEIGFFFHCAISIAPARAHHLPGLALNVTLGKIRLLHDRPLEPGFQIMIAMHLHGDPEIISRAHNLFISRSALQMDLVLRVFY